MIRKFALVCAFLLASSLSFAQAPTNLVPDPCETPYAAKSYVAFNITTATTTQLVTAVAATSVYVCGFSLTVSNVVTTANTIKFIQGSGATCSGSPSDLTGTYNAGSVTAAPPTAIVVPATATAFKTTLANGVCAVTTIGATAFFSGVLTYIQQ